MLFDELDRVIRGNVIDPALGWSGGSVDLERRVEVFPLANETGGVVETGALAALATHVPLADVSGRVAGGFDRGRAGFAVFRKVRLVVRDAVHVIVPSRHECRAAWRAQ